MGEIISDEELRQHFPSNKESKYSGKCEYCGVDVNFSDQTQAKIITGRNKEKKKFIVYHINCYDRYLKRTID